MVNERQIGALHAELDISPLLAERREVLWTLIVSNAALTLLLAALGWFAVRRMVAPMKILAEHLEAAPDGSVTPIPDEWIPPANTETGRLFRSFNRMAHAVAERQSLMTRLAEEERMGSLGRLASGVAHEINNPLGGLFNALDTLKVHGARPQVRSTAIDLLERGLRGIRDVVRSALAVYRSDREKRDLVVADIDDLRLLIGPEIRRKQINLLWENGLPREVGVVAFPVRQVVLNLLLNACRATPERGFVALSAQLISARVVITVDDSGPGLPEHIAGFFEGLGEPAPIGKGLGLWMARRTITDLNGTIGVDTSPLGGARIRMTIPLRIDAGDLAHVA
jgi:signal transduction histidine kinase